MAKKLVTADGNEVTKVAPTLPSGRTLVQHKDGGALDVVDAATLRVEDTEDVSK